ncbi:hypothetical protein [Sulfurimonas sp.]|uniref:hypothetical protein n=1 Tax=Sulfurimonas sp. TaxID=2022749 RepID=UPI003564BA19
MNTLKLSATLMLLGSLTLGMSATIDEQVAAIGSATPEERVALVNEFKKTVSTLSTEERAEAIAQLRSSMNAKGDQVQTQTRERTRERSRIHQMEQTENMQRTQQMQQNRLGSGGNTPNKFMGNK